MVLNEWCTLYVFAVFVCSVVSLGGERQLSYQCKLLQAVQYVCADPDAIQLLFESINDTYWVW